MTVVTWYVPLRVLVVVGRWRSEAQRSDLHLYKSFPDFQIGKARESQKAPWYVPRVHGLATVRGQQP